MIFFFFLIKIIKLQNKKQLIILKQDCNDHGIFYPILMDSLNCDERNHQQDDRTKNNKLTLK